MLGAGVRVVRGPDWCWGEQDEGEGHVGTVVKPRLGPDGPRLKTVMEGIIFVRWDNGVLANYRVGLSHDLRILRSAAAGNQQHATCDVCSAQSYFGARWKCCECDDYDLCDECYHGDRHDVTHPFKRFDLAASEGVLVPPRKNSEKLTAYGAYPGATVIRSVEDWLLGDTDGGDEQCQGTVLDTHSDTDDDDDDDDGDDDDDTDDDDDRQRALLARLIRRHRSPKHHGMVRVLWSDSESGRVRVGRDGHVDIWCVSSAPGGQFYRDHLGVLDEKLVSTGDDDEDDDDDEVWVDEAAGVTDSIRTRTPLERLLAQLTVSRNAPLLPGNDQFRRGDRVVIHADPHHFREMQTERYGGWNDEMALCIGVAGEVQGVMETGSVVVRYQSLSKKWTVNPDLLDKKKFLVGDKVRILNDEQAVREMQKGHGGWVHRMKDMLGQVSEVVRADSGDCVSVRFSDKYEWQVNVCACQLVDAADFDFIHTGSLLDSQDVIQPRCLVEFAAENKLELVRAVLLQHPDKVNVRNTGKTALHLSALNNHQDVVRLLLDHDADVAAADDAGNTPLHYAVFKDNAAVLSLMLDKSNDADVVNFKLRSVLHVAVYEESLRCVDVLLQHSASLTSQDEAGNTPLHTAIHVSCHHAIEQMTAHHSVDYHIVNNDELNVLQLAVLKGDIRAVEKIMSRGPGDLVNSRKSDDGMTPLHLACQNGFREIAELLIEQGKATIDVRNARKYTAMMCGLLTCKASVTELLVQHGADVNAADVDGDTCLHMILRTIARGDASKHQLADMFNTVDIPLIYSELGDDIEDGDKQWTAMSCFLLRHGADLYRANSKGERPANFINSHALHSALTASLPPGTDKPTDRPALSP